VETPVAKYPFCMRTKWRAYFRDYIGPERGLFDE
jgi:hypothetical protein